MEGNKNQNVPGDLRHSALIRVVLVDKGITARGFHQMDYSGSPGSPYSGSPN
jgi:hypothetical protein